MPGRWPPIRHIAKRTFQFPWRCNRNVSGWPIGSCENTAANGPPMLAELKPGSIAIHHDKIVHGSPGNTSERGRLSLVLTLEFR